MAISIQGMPNTTIPDSVYPDGQIKDDTGSDDGTPATVLTVGDMFQYFAKTMRDGGITPNNLPDNEYSGNQFFEAFNLLSKRYRSVQEFTTNIFLNKTHLNSLLLYLGDGSGNKTLQLPDVTETKTGDFIEIINDNSLFQDSVTINVVSGVLLPNNTTAIVLLPGETIKLIYYHPSTFIREWYILYQPADVPQSITLGSDWFATGAPPRVKLINWNTVKLSGIPTNVSGTWNSATITLPDAKYFPKSTTSIAVTINDNGVYRNGLIIISTLGGITISTGVTTGSNVRFFLDGLTYSID